VARKVIGTVVLWNKWSEFKIVNDRCKPLESMVISEVIKEEYVPYGVNVEASASIEDK
jgi:hypothetical protein